MALLFDVGLPAEFDILKGDTKKVLLPPSILPSAKNVSYHTLETFPEKNYGFLDLPVMDAEKLQRKLNGTIFKGTKVRVEEARPQKTFFNAAVSDDVAITGKVAQSSQGHLERRRREENVVAGVELPGSRTVQRGWTKPTPLVASKKQKLRTQASSYTTTSECLFRTTLPANVVPNAPPLIARTKARMEERRVKDRAGRETVVHEFSSTTKFSSFLRDNGMPKTGKVVFEFVDGKGWVDDEGNVIEAIKENTMLAKGERDASDSQASPQNTDSNLVAEVDSGAEGQEYDSDCSESDDDDDGDDDDESDSSGDSGSTCSTPDGEWSGEDIGNSRDKELALQMGSLPSKESAPITSQPSSASSVPGLALTIPTTTTSPISIGSVPNLSLRIPTNSPRRELHPLEAVFKHPSTIDSSIIKSSVELATPFTFFGPDGENVAGSPSSALQTPFTRKDILQRGIRSAAPTPDTAARWKRIPILWPNGINESDEEMESGKEIPENTSHQGKAALPAIIGGAGPATATSELDVVDPSALPLFSDDALIASLAKELPAEEKGFEEIFYEKRGEMNRHWKKRRREALKEKRKRENKKRRVA
ncbi:hypothetical protein FGG08_005961 [Glutinoglossum americanum]|uniref:Uncharacterized protein n=1 Tax=Glutinoglossum americanum TaxID=1670608 RepID=A0A9P8HXC9_9PEZI|nr:hypothetical protein FGG08_005961 [Glutinoglossum americanum]